MSHQRGGNQARNKRGAGAGGQPELDGGGGLASPARGGGMGFCCEVCSFLLSHFFHGSPTPPSLFVIQTHFPLSFFFPLGYRTIEEGRKLREEVQKMESEGWEKIGAAVAGLEAEGLYRLLRGVIAQSSMSHVPPPSKKCHHSPTSTISKPPSQEP